MIHESQKLSWVRQRRKRIVWKKLFPKSEFRVRGNNVNKRGEVAVTSCEWCCVCGPTTNLSPDIFPTPPVGSISPTFYMQLLRTYVGHAAFCAYVLGLYFTGGSLPAQKLCVKRWWNWAHISDFLECRDVTCNVFLTRMQVNRYFIVIFVMSFTGRQNSGKQRCSDTL